jgi:23S rRNA pseudouridine955/2504/2580 synthase
LNPDLYAKVSFLTITDDYHDQRIDNFLFTHLKNMPKTRIYRLLRKGEIRVNKKRVSAPYRLQAGDILRLPPMFHEEVVPPIPGERTIDMLKDTILYEDKGLLIINKPPGIPVHGGTGIHVGVVEALRNMYPAHATLELAHRIDIDTSGCLILAKKRSVLRELHGLMREGKVTKHYTALTKGHWKPHEYIVDVPLLKNHLNSGERMVKVDKEGKPSLTVFTPIETFGQLMLVDAALHTGRTHQIRVHARYRNHSLVGDEKYGDKALNKTMREKGLKRCFLHAHFVSFTLPSTGETLAITAPLPDDLADCLTVLRGEAR